MADRWYDRYINAWNERDATAVTSFMTPDIIYEDVTTRRTFSGTDEIFTYLQSPERQTSDFRFQVVDFFESGDRFASEWVLTGTHTRVYSSLASGFIRAMPGMARALPGVARAQADAPTVKSFRVRGATVGSLETDKICAQRDYWNMADLMDQLGLMPEAPG